MNPSVPTSTYSSCLHFSSVSNDCAFMRMFIQHEEGRSPSKLSKNGRPSSGGRKYLSVLRFQMHAAITTKTYIHILSLSTCECTLFAYRVFSDVIKLRISS